MVLRIILVMILMIILELVLDQTTSPGVSATPGLSTISVHVGKFKKKKKTLALRIRIIPHFHSAKACIEIHKYNTFILN